MRLRRTSLRRARLAALCAAPFALTACLGDGLFAERADEPAAPVETEAGYTPTPDEVRADLVENGREIVEAECAICHAVHRDDISPRTDAPPLRIVLEGYDPEALATDLREGIQVSHTGMPNFDFSPEGADAVLAYLRSIQN